MFLYQDNYDPRILEGIAKIKEDVRKSCGAGGINEMSNPNLIKDRVQVSLINMAMDTSKLLSMVTTLNAKCSGKLTRLDMDDTVSVGACTQCTVGADLLDSYIPFDLVKYKTQVDIDNDFLECNDIGSPEQVKEIILAMMLTNMRNDMEKSLLYGNTELPTGAGQPKLNNLLGVNDGVLKIACECLPECAILDAQGQGLSPELFMAARKALSPRYRSLRNGMQFLHGPGISDWYQQYLANRPTDAGDNALRNGEMAKIWGNQMEEIPTWREDFEYGAPGAEQEVTHMLLTDPKNIVYVAGREFQRKEKELLECDRQRFIGYWKSDVIIQEPEKMVLVKNIGVCNFDNPWAGCGVQCIDGDIPNPASC